MAMTFSPLPFPFLFFSSHYLDRYVCSVFIVCFLLHREALYFPAFACAFGRLVGWLAGWFNVSREG